MKLTVTRQSRPPEQMTALWRNVIGGIAALPGVVAVGGTTALPLGHSESISTFRVEGYANRPNQTAAARQTSGDYFQAMQMRLLAGRVLRVDDIPAQPSSVPPAVVVSESFARLYFPGGNAIGGHLQREPGKVWSSI